MKKILFYAGYVIAGLVLLYFADLAHAEEIEQSYAQVPHLTIDGKTYAGTSSYGVASTVNVDMNLPVNIVYLKAASLGGTSLYATNDGQKTGYLYRTKLIIVQNSTGTGALGWCDPLFDMKSGVSPTTSTTAHKADWYALEVNGASGTGTSIFVTQTAAGRSAP